MFFLSLLLVILVLSLCSSLTLKKRTLHKFALRLGSFRSLGTHPRLKGVDLTAEVLI